MKKIITIFILVSLIITLFTPVAQAAKKTTTLEGKTVYVYTQAEINEVIRVVYAESRNQPYLGMIGVAQSAFNRFENNHGKYSMSYITRNKGKSRQYAKASKSILKSKNKSVIASVAKCRKAVLYAMNNRIFPKICTMFQRANRPHWGSNRNIPRYCRIGAHTFYTTGKAKPIKGPKYVDRNGKLIRRK